MDIATLLDGLRIYHLMQEGVLKGFVKSRNARVAVPLEAYEFCRAQTFQRQNSSQDV